jgi:4-amino-4-deoxy-L-arabinose transferase-like glycosyltransferase
MTTVAAGLRTTALPARMVASWNALAARCNPAAVIVAAWAMLTLPLVAFRGFNSDEGLAVSIARTALETGEWLTPHRFNVRWIERPTLLSWIIAALSEPFGAVSQITARLPLALFLLFGCFLIYWLLRKAAASVPAALVGVALFLACPLVIRSYVMITADMPLAVLLFFAFVLWWSGYQDGAVGFGRWLAIGVVLAFAGLLKGPQPLAYFVLGVGLFVVGTRSWRQIPGLIAAAAISAVPLALWYRHVYEPGDERVWATFMRLHASVAFSNPLEAVVRTLVDTLPAAVLAAAFLMSYGFRERRYVRPALVAALACYAFVAAFFILFWPGGSTPRYYFPVVLPLCVFGGLGYDLLGPRRPAVLAPVLVLTAALLAYALAYALASPFMPTLYRPAQIEGARVAELVKAVPAPIYRTHDTGLNVLPYVPGQIFDAKLDELETVPGPGWMLVPAEEAAALLARRGNELHAVMTLGDDDQWRLLRLDR